MNVMFYFFELVLMNDRCCRCFFIGIGVENRCRFFIIRIVVGVLLSSSGQVWWCLVFYRFICVMEFMVIILQLFVRQMVNCELVVMVWWLCVFCQSGQCLKFRSCLVVVFVLMWCFWVLRQVCLINMKCFGWVVELLVFVILCFCVKEVGDLLWFVVVMYLGLLMQVFVKNLGSLVFVSCDRYLQVFSCFLFIVVGDNFKWWFVGCNYVYLGIGGVYCEDCCFMWC